MNKLKIDLADEIQDTQREIEILKDKIKRLEVEKMKSEDEGTKYIEKIEDHPEAHLLNKQLVGRIYWEEDVFDEDTGDVIKLKRNKIIKVNGTWVI